MRWSGRIPIGPASADLGSLAPGVQGSAVMENVPSDGNFPRPNEQWQLTNIYLPFLVQAVWTAAAATKAQVVLQLLKAGSPVWVYSATLDLITAPATNSAIDNAAAVIDLTNPITLEAGSAALTLTMAAAVDQPADVRIGVGFLQQAFNLTAPSPGVILYTAMSLDEVS